MPDQMLSDPFTTQAHLTERSVAAKLCEWINEIIRNQNLPLGEAWVETQVAGRLNDILLSRSPGSRQALCVVEVKLPFVDPLSQGVIDYALGYARLLQAPYVCTCNINQLIWFHTEKLLDPTTSPGERIIDRYHLSTIADPDTIVQPAVRLSIQQELKRFLADLAQVVTGERVKPKLAIDDLLIFRLYSAIETLAVHYTTLVAEQTQKSPAFAQKLAGWFVEQGWNFTYQTQDYDRVGRQAAYLLVNKILFYAALQQQLHLPPLLIPTDLFDGGILKAILQAYFQKVLDIDYETIFSTDFIDGLAFPEHYDAVETVKELVLDINRYQVAKIGYDVIGRIFERLIPEEERHKLGQYFTNPDVVDLILRFCKAYEPEAKVFDPACGAGTFLVRAYHQKKIADPRLKHDEILATLWGCDIAKFPAHLSTINLAVYDLSVRENYPRITHKDFFDLLPTTVEFARPRLVELGNLGLEERTVEHPRYFDAVVGNPPYTRQEEMADIAGGTVGYKQDLINKALTDVNGERRLADISERAGIYAYFFVHGAKFLQNGGRFGFVVSNAWLDVDYGKGLQEFFLKHFKVLAIVESKVERWFADADINTCIVILEKASGESRQRERDDNLVHFAQLLKPLRHFIPPAESAWDHQVARLQAVDDLMKSILSKWQYYEDDTIRIFPKRQGELWHEGYDEEEEKYVGSKWGKYLRAPEILFQVLEKGKGKLVSLEQVASVRFGIKTGANDFFYLTEDEIRHWGIEREFWMHVVSKEELERLQQTPFWDMLKEALWQEGEQFWLPNYVVKSPRECESILVDPARLRSRVLLIHKPREALAGTRVLTYIEEGEQRGYHERPTCSQRQRVYDNWAKAEPEKRLPEPTYWGWYDLGHQSRLGFLWQMIHFSRHIVPTNVTGVFVDHNLFIVRPKDGRPLGWGAILNSTLYMLFKELYGRVNLGQGSLKTEGVDIKRLPVPTFEHWASRQHKLEQIVSGYKARDVFREIGARELNGVTLAGIHPDRRALDRLVMGDILGLTDEEQLEVYRAVIDLVQARLEKAKSVKAQRPRMKGGVNVDQFVQMVLDKVPVAQLAELYHQVQVGEHALVSLPVFRTSPRLDKTLFGYELTDDRQRLEVLNEAQGRYLAAWALLGLYGEAPVPADEATLAGLLPQLEKLAEEARQSIEQYLGSIVDRKLRDQLGREIRRKMKERVVFFNYQIEGG
ncbi:MAG: SAM-dependent DNA methyltransferase [Chloroflexi bacterium]|nr:SAM-dependent DNA methyltransferase [Chloroflexota bacterium]